MAELTGREEGSGETPRVVVTPGMSAAEIRAALQSSQRPDLSLFDPGTGKLLGILLKPDVVLSFPAHGASDAAVQEADTIPRLGGMATPLGVYLTDGVVSGGASFLGLVLTGMMLCGMGIIAQTGIQALQHAIQRGSAVVLPISYSAAGALPYLLSLVVQAGGFLPLLLLFVLFRLTPISGTHAAEHQVVHCVERQEPLTLETVRQMPRVHPRCGTNLVAGMSLFLAVFVGVFLTMQDHGSSPPNAASLAAAAAAVVAFTFWRDVGSFLQYWLATRPATDLQIGGAIKAAEQVIKRRAAVQSLASPPRFPGPLRLWRMGFVQVLSGYAVMFEILALLAAHFPALSRILETTIYD